MKISKKGIKLIKQFEGCRLSAYRCPAGVWTIGYGHTSGVKRGDKITQEDAESYLIKDLKKYEKRVEMYNPIYGWTQSEFDALVSFCYNIGSISGLTKNGKRSRSQIVSAWCRYNKAGGKKLAGLTRRRLAEVKMFKEG